MDYQTFRNAMSPFMIFSINDIRKQFPGFDSRRLTEWQKKNYLTKIANRWYLFKETEVNELLRYRISNCLAQPSYISLESALAFYNLIPEGVFTIQAVTTQKPKLAKTPLGHFQFRTIKKELYFGYQILHDRWIPVLIAEIEKALLDFLYFSPQIKTVEDLAEMRFNFIELQIQTDWNKMQNYASLFKSKTMDKRLNLLHKTMNNAVIK